MPRMLGTCRRAWCPYCRCPAGPDCPSVARSKRAARAREKRAWQREAAAGFASLTLDPSPRLRQAREKGTQIVRTLR